jgi:hypothetical protein
MAEQPPRPPTDPPGDDPVVAAESRRRLIGLVLVLAAASIAYRLVYLTGAEKTSALYVGVPTVLAIGLALLPRSGSATGMLMRGGTLAMLLACVLLPEGLICLLFALPLVALVAIVVGGTIDVVRQRRRRQGPTLLALSLPLALLSLEGVVGSPVDRHDAVVASTEVEASPTEVEAALARPPSFDADLPTFLSFGFNRPVLAMGTGLDVGDRRTIQFSGGSHDDHPVRLLQALGGGSHDHQDHELSAMQLVVSEHAPGRVVFELVRDDTMLSRWVDLDRAVVTWQATGDHRTRVEWRFEYERLIAPAWYFGPLQRFGLDDAAEYLLDSTLAGVGS